MALTRPPEATSHGKNWCPVELGASRTGLLHVLPPSVENTYSICPWPEGWATWNAITRVRCTLSAARYGAARSNRGKVNPVGQANRPSPQSREPLPADCPDVNAV